MAGIVGTFQMRLLVTELPDQPGGYCHISNISGGAGWYLGGNNPGGLWKVDLQYFGSYAGFLAGEPPIDVSNIYYPDMSAKIAQEIFVPYVPNADPYGDAMNVLQSWWPTGEVKS